MTGQTRIEIHGSDFWLNGGPTYAGRRWAGHRIEGLLLNARMVQATFDDLNPATRDRWKYPDTGRWDPDRNVQEFLEMLPIYRRHGLLAVTVNCQGGSPEGYSREQPWENSAFSPDGALRPANADRLRRVLEAADGCGMAVIVGYFYQGQDERLRDEAAVLRAVDEATDFLLDGSWTNVLVEVNNECDTRYEHELSRARPNTGRERRPCGRLHPTARQQYGRPSAHRRSGRADPPAAGLRWPGDYVHGYQLVPVNWRINTARKQEFFTLLADITGEGHADS